MRLQAPAELRSLLAGFGLVLLLALDQAGLRKEAGTASSALWDSPSLVPAPASAQTLAEGRRREAPGSLLPPERLAALVGLEPPEQQGQASASHHLKTGLSRFAACSSRVSAPGEGAGPSPAARHGCTLRACPGPELSSFFWVCPVAS